MLALVPIVLAALPLEIHVSADVDVRLEVVRVDGKVMWTTTLRGENAKATAPCENGARLRASVANLEPVEQSITHVRKTLECSAFILAMGDSILFDSIDLKAEAPPGLVTVVGANDETGQATLVVRNARGDSASPIAIAIDAFSDSECERTALTESNSSRAAEVRFSLDDFVSGAARGWHPRPQVVRPRRERLLRRLDSISLPSAQRRRLSASTAELRTATALSVTQLSHHSASWMVSSGNGSMPLMTSSFDHVPWSCQTAPTS